MTTASQPHRSPSPANRLRDSERTKAKLLDAALDEFAEYGFAGARVNRIADRAGVNKQLINYYFGGKTGLYRALLRTWLDAEHVAASHAQSTEDMMRWYLHATLDDSRGTRLGLWHSLSHEAPEVEQQSDIDREQDRIRHQQQTGELPADVESAALQLAVMGMVTAPITFRHSVHKLFGLDVESPEFEQRYAAALSTLLSRLKTAPSSQIETDIAED